jgi:hypothetical protein
MLRYCFCVTSGLTLWGCGVISYIANSDSMISQICGPWAFVLGLVMLILRSESGDEIK